MTDASGGGGRPQARGYSLTDLLGVTAIGAALGSIVTAILAGTLLHPPRGGGPPSADVAVPAAPTVASAPPAAPTPGPSPAFEEPSVDAAPSDGAWPAAAQGAREVAVTRADALVVRRVARIATDNPHWSAWRDCAYVEVQVMPQQMAMPTLPAATIDKVRLQGMTDGRSIAWRASWQDPTPDGNVDVGRFSDAVAIGFPLDPGAPPMMGARTLRVQLLYWKALWQKDLDVGFQDVQDLHPNFWSDIYWFAEGRFPYPVPAAFQQPASRQWFIAHQAGNPMAAFSRSQPIEELVAEGWSTLTHQPDSATSGKGAWLDRTWAVVFQRPLKTTDPLDYAFATGGKGQVVCAVWDGSAGNRGGRKHWSGWTDFEVER